MSKDVLHGHVATPDNKLLVMYFNDNLNPASFEKATELRVGQKSKWTLAPTSRVIDEEFPNRRRCVESIQMTALRRIKVLR